MSVDFPGFPHLRRRSLRGLGDPTSTPLLAGFIAICVAELVVGALLWSGRPIGLWLALALLPFELIYWIGFALPFGPILGTMRTVLVTVALTGR